MLGQDEDADCQSVLRPDRLGRPKALIGVRGRHPDVDDRDIRAVLARGSQERLRVAHLGDHLEARVAEETSRSLAHEERVVGQDEPERHEPSTSARMAVPETRSFGMKPRMPAVASRRP